jgi:hypothetical protein
MTLTQTITFFLLVLFPLLFAQAQNQINISGQVTDATNQALIDASITLLHPNDSSFIKGVSTDLDGNFELSAPAYTQILLKISYVGYTNLFLLKQLNSNALPLGKIVLQEKTALLNEVKIVGILTPVQQKNDTTQFNAGAFKTNKDANAEDLVTKMPGINIQDGKVQAQGENVQKVLVDGRDFFGDDANAVLKNLPAEIIDKIQIFDQKSTQSQLSGFDDGNTAKTINIITKAAFKNGTFGKAYAGYGYEDKWKGGLNLNFFKNKRRITILASSNNVNEQNFSSEDLLGVMSSSSGGNSGGRGSGRRGGSGRQGGDQWNNTESFLVDAKNGIATTHAFGINYANQWKKVDFTSSYFFNYSNNNALNNLFRQYIINPNTGLSYTEQAKNNSQNTNHRLNLKFDWKIDSLNAISFQPKISLQQNNGTSTLTGQNTELTTLLSSTNSQYQSQLVGINASTNFTYRHAFANKKGRTFSANLTPTYNPNKGDSHLDAYTFSVTDTLATTDSLRQEANKNVQGFNFSSNTVFTEPINPKSQLLFSHKLNTTQNKSNKETFNYTATDANYTLLDTTLSNNFNTHYLSQALGLNYRYQQIKWDITLGLSYQHAQLNSKQIFPDSFNLHKTFNSILPETRFQYRFSDKQNLRINYRSNNNAPSVSQLQAVINNSNPLQLSTGNPDLKQDWQNMFSIRYSSSNTQKASSFFAFLNASYTQNYIANTTFIASTDTLIAPQILLAKGSQLSMPLNLNGYFSIRTFNNYSLPLKKIKSNLSLNIGGSYTQTPSQINSQLNYARSYNATLGLVLSSNINEKIDFTASSNLTYNHIANTLQSTLNSSYYNQNSRLKLQITPYKYLVLQTELNHQYNSGLSGAFNQNYLLWNAAIGYKLLKKQQAELRLTAFDLLKQNNNITRNTTETYYEDIQTNVLQRYFMLSFIYNIRQFKETK